MSDGTWPEMVEGEYDEEGWAIDGTTPTSVVHISGRNRHGQPTAAIASAACAYCNRWAVDLYVAFRNTVDGTYENAIHRRMEMTLIYYCDQHIETAAEELLEAHGACSNSLSDQIELALEVSKVRRALAIEDYQRNLRA